jgi:hypothetical protein
MTVRSQVAQWVLQYGLLWAVGKALLMSPFLVVVALVERADNIIADIREHDGLTK